ncbi:MAG: metabolite traffic protein EboE [Acidobacteriota bacterium]
MHPVTYCTNIHPGESWAQTRANLADHTLAVKAAVCPDRPFPVGLRVSGLASREVSPEEAVRFRAWMDENGLYVATVNGFPFGTFHGRPVKSGVYQPDWRDPARLDYTLKLAELLAIWLPDGMDGSISTVPVGFRADFDPDQESIAHAALRRAAEGMDAVAQRTGKRIRLSLEPEPGCLVETTPELIGLFDRLALPEHLRPTLAACYDCCHQALQFEDPAWSLAQLADNGVAIGHVQVSSALHLPCADLSRLTRFDEPVYLHQCVARSAQGSLERFDDLGDALAASMGSTGHGSPDADRAASAAAKPQRLPARPVDTAAGRASPDGRKAHTDQPGPGETGPSCLENADCWRVHFHLPVFLAELPECLSTQPFLKDFLPLVPLSVPLEVETYTFGVLPPELQTPTVVESIVREIQWVEDCRSGK